MLYHRQNLVLLFSYAKLIAVPNHRPLSSDKCYDFACLELDPDLAVDMALLAEADAMGSADADPRWASYYLDRRLSDLPLELEGFRVLCTKDMPK